MQTILKVINSAEVRVLLHRHGLAVRDEAARILKMAARGLASEYGAMTDPPDFGGPDVVEKFKARIAGEIDRVFPTRENVGKVYQMIKQRDPVLAAAYYHAAKSGKVSSAAAIVRKAGLPQGSASVAALKNARSRRRARVAGRVEPVSLLRASESRSFVRGQQALVGTAKAGWHQAAAAIGGRVRSNYVSSAGKRSTAERFPKYVRAVSRRFGDLGGALVGDERITIYNQVRHASDAMSDRRRVSAESNAQDTTLKALRMMLSKLSEKLNRSA